jgi:hypothetical protein
MNHRGAENTERRQKAEDRREEQPQINAERRRSEERPIKDPTRRTEPDLKRPPGLGTLPLL